MKSIELNENYAIIKFNKTEIKIFNDILLKDNFFNKKIEVTNLPSNQYLLKKKNDVNIKICLDYLKHCFAKETIEGIIKIMDKKYSIS
jgi:hypothetical protein